MRSLKAGSWVTVVGVVFGFIALFLPRLSSKVYATVVDNTLIQTTDGIIFLVLLAAAAGLLAAYVVKGQRSYAIGQTVAGALLTALAVFSLADGSSRTLQPFGEQPDDVMGALDYLSATETAAPGTGLILVTVGSLLVLAGSVMTLMNK